jgi:Zn finger protein HypA/HybF involved in hydrogenase expression
MQILIDIPKRHYENIMNIDSVSLGRIPYKGIIMYSINAIKNGVVQEHRKGHWILTDVEGNRIWFCNCSECGKDPQDYISGTENWWLTKSKLPNYCPNCGSDNREVEDGDDNQHINGN